MGGPVGAAGVVPRLFFLPAMKASKDTNTARKLSSRNPVARWFASFFAPASGI
jgi:hypothetical protein